MKTRYVPRPKLCCTVAAIIVACGWLAAWVGAPATMTVMLVTAARAMGANDAQAALASGHAVIFGLMTAFGLVVSGLVVVAAGRMMRATCRLVWQRKRTSVAPLMPYRRAA